jgi:glycosyltransferase involved in cell wall biosynthesis
MESISVIVPAHNNASVVRRTLQSVEDSLACFRAKEPRYRDVPAEVVAVDDGSDDDTLQILRDATAGKKHYRVVPRDTPSSPAHARNVGVAHASGGLLFFLDGDDLFLPEHVYECYRNLGEPGCCFAKGRVGVDDPVHADWQECIDHSVVINLCVRRWCHDFIGGFPDYHLAVRQDGALGPPLDVFYKVEDMFYNELVTRLFPGVQIRRETVRHLRYPGNTFDRQYEKFRRPRGTYREAQPDDYRFRLAVADAITRERLRVLKARLAGLPERPWLAGCMGAGPQAPPAVAGHVA